MMTETHTCPACRTAPLELFHEARFVPTNSCLLMETPEEAIRYPRGDIRLGFCRACGFITNTAFTPELTEYSARYEETQGYSPAFNTFHRALAQRLIDRYDLAGRKVIEIGCGKGEFLDLLCEIGGCTGLGFDPGFIPERASPGLLRRARVIRDFYSEAYADETADFVCCKMTLEHIPDVGAFLATVRRTVGDNPDTPVFFQVPDAARILDECAFWDIYYEHCSYFTAPSLSALFRRSGFEIVDLGLEYDGQYLTIEARPADRSASLPANPPEAEVAELRRRVVSFALRQQSAAEAWRAQTRSWACAGRKVVLWGSGSKAVAFLTTLGLGSEIAEVVDINPHRQGRFMPGTGHRIVGPQDLAADPPDVVVAMNPVYRAEIAKDLAARGLAPEIVTV